MQIKTIKIELVDKESRLVLKKIITSDGREFLNRKLAVENSIYTCEKQRLNWDKPLFNSPIQTYHIRYAKNEKEWDYTGLKGVIKHAEENKRLFFPYKQRNEEQGNKLEWKDTGEDINEFLNKDNDYIPVAIPIKTTESEWIKKRKEILSTLPKNKKIFPIFSSKHKVEYFYPLIKYEMGMNSVIGFNCYEINSPIEITNLSKVRYLNSQKKVGEDCSLIIYFNYPRMLTRHSYVGGAFAFNCFAGDIFSQKAYFIKGMRPEDIQNMMKKKYQDYYFYDPKQKGFNKSLNQKDWYGFELTKNFLKEVSVDEGLSGYNSIRWFNHLLQQKDFDLINENLLQKNKIVDIIKNYSRWGVLWQRTVEPSLKIIPQTLDGFQK